MCHMIGSPSVLLPDQARSTDCTGALVEVAGSWAEGQNVFPEDGFALVEVAGSWAEGQNRFSRGQICIDVCTGCTGALVGVAGFLLE